jgi:tetratricopeptide (TPR) repeat protein
VRSANNIEMLLEAGLKAYGNNETDTAFRLWTQVLEIQPENAQARDFLTAAGMELPPPPPAQLAQIVDLGQARQQRESEADARAVLRAKVEQLVRERRLEDALNLLDQARPRFPEDPSISRSIRILRDRLVVDYGRLLGRLDDIPRLTLSREEILKQHLSPEEIALLKMIDGIASLGDIVRGSHLGRFEAYRAFLLFRERGWLTTRAPTGAWSSRTPTPAAEPASEPETAPRRTPPPPAPAPEASTTPAPPSASPLPTGNDLFDQLFRQATEAYVRRAYPQAIELFLQCAALRPEDRRVQHNLQRLQTKQSS